MVLGEGIGKMYTWSAVLFLVGAIIVFGATFYIIWARVEIVVAGQEQAITEQFVFTAGGANAVRATLLTIPAEVTGTFEATGEAPVDDSIVGEVTIVNEYSQGQTLIESTRLAQANDPTTIVGRLRRTVVVPPGASVTVQVYTDTPESFSAVTEKRLIIPGLWGPLQEKIYAQNNDGLKTGGYTVAVVTEDDLTKARESLKENLYQASLQKIGDQVPSQEQLWPKLVQEDGARVSFDAQANDQAKEFIGTMSATTTVVVFDEAAVVAMAKEKIIAQSGREVVQIEASDLVYTLEKVNGADQTAEISVSVKGQVAGKAQIEQFDKAQLTGKTTEEVKAYFSQFADVKEVKVNFYPNWLKKTPRLMEKIEIVFE